MIAGTSMGDCIHGEQGNDSIKSMGDDNTLVGGSGNDKLYWVNQFLGSRNVISAFHRITHNRIFSQSQSFNETHLTRWVL